MAVQGETTQFTARLENRMLTGVRRLAKKQGVSTNEKLNEIVMLGLIAYSKKQKARLAATSQARLSTKGTNNSLEKQHDTATFSTISSK